uniref:Antimicrobial peptide ctriporin n=1 Tax=Chaerilus tricostatus TaxID=1055734 RepID=NDB4A_CHATC|nr:RecName: Full=Antimicrobial peptide ctriporin; Short=Riporin; AltName: Full=Non-disulfide-bridged peptide 4.10; Short=NDBP-4.10; Flags: Precursor [Chaerilus tricostatus]AEK32596.1 antimicrobial peptide riporin [Chaerilus tricostatus]
MDSKYLFVFLIFNVIVIDLCQGFLWGLIPGAISAVTSLIKKGRRRRELGSQYDYLQDFRKRELDLDDLLSKFPDY